MKQEIKGFRETSIKLERFPNPRETTVKNLGNAGSPRRTVNNEDGGSYTQGQRNQGNNRGTSSRNYNKISRQFPGGSQQTAGQVRDNERPNQLQEGSTNGNTISPSDTFPLEGYKNKDGKEA